MIPAAKPGNENLRLKVLHDLDILDTAPEAVYDEITELAALICEAPISLVSMIDGDRQWFKSKVGIDIAETPRETSFCAHVILGDELFEITDSRKDVRFQDNPFVLSEPPVIFYAGVPLEVEESVRVGTLCVVDHKPRKLTDRQRKALRCLSNQVRDQLRLRKANTDLRKAFQARSHFFSAMTHEIRTPLNGILGVTDLLMDSVGAREQENLRTIKACGKTLLRVVNDMLDFAKMESGGMDLEVRPFCLQDLVAQSLSLLEPLARSKGLDLVVSPQKASGWFLGDATRIGQILFNLIGNAIKFSDHGTVRLEVEPLHPDRLRLSIRDQGKGIPDSMKDRLFKRFSQVDGCSDAKRGGTGLGLVIAKGLAEAMDGTITFESQVGLGTTFCVDIRCERAPVGAASEVPAGPDWKASGASAGPLRVLLAEDEEVNQMVALGFLAKLGLAADLARDGQEAVAMADAKRYDIVLMDCKMPGMDGPEAAGRILAAAKVAGHGEPVILALTASATDEVRRRCLEAGMRDVLLKPVSFESLQEALFRGWVPALGSGRKEVPPADTSNLPKAVNR